MKNNSQILQFTGYPLKVVDDVISRGGKPVMYLIPVQKQQLTYSLFFTVPVVNKPENWDSEWFGNYE